MAYQPVSFESGETLTSTKMNQMAANDASFHDGSGIDDNAIAASKLNLSSFGSQVANITNGHLDGQKERTIGSLTLQPGTYLLIATTSGLISRANLYVYLQIIRQSDSEIICGNGTTSQQNEGAESLTTMRAVTVESETTFDLKCGFGNTYQSSDYFTTSLSGKSATFAAIRIG